MGFEQSNSDTCIYTLSGGETFVIGIYVDDIILAGKDCKQMEEIKRVLGEKFDVFSLSKHSCKSQQCDNVDWSTHAYRKGFKEVWNGICKGD